MAETRREAIRRIYRNSGLDGLWRWITNARLRGEIRRFRAAREWAANQAQEARQAGKHKDAEKWAERRDEYSEHFRRVKQRWLERNEDPAVPPPSGTLTTFDGKQVPLWIVQRALAPARASGAWSGYVISGVRSPEYSESLCFDMCGAPTCPGTCGGRYSNHACPPSGKGVEFEGAVDVTDPAGLQAYCRAHSVPLIGNGERLPYDHPHFSHAGN